MCILARCSPPPSGVGDNGLVMSRWRRARRVGAGAFIVLLAVATVVVVQPQWAFGVLEFMSPDIVWRVPTTAPLVALSFDDGPAPDHTPRVLEILARHQARATFFLIGTRVERFPLTVAQIRAGGHEVGNHSFTLRSMRSASDEAFEADVLRTERALGLQAPKLYRPPGGLIRRSQIETLKRHGYQCVLGNAYPYDGKGTTSSAYIEWLVTRNLRPGTIVILHDGIADPSRSLAALDAILTAGREKGLRFVSVGELLASR
jgi:peptidoglycan/xylan/chitin deacetylase (PgdA/CDA1 family)